MEKYIEKENELPIYREVDVLVCGGGPAGAGAAIRAGRLGAETLIVEMQSCLGGMATAGLMSHWTGYASSDVMCETIDRSIKKYPILGYNENNRCETKRINQEAHKIVLEEMLKEANVEILYYTLVCKAVVDNGKIRGVIIENKSGRSFIKAKVVIDATGDGDVAYSAGVPYFKGRESDGKMQPCTLMFKIGGVDYDKAVFPGSFETLVPTEKGELQTLAKNKLPSPAGHVLLYRQPTDGTVCCNMTNAVGTDGTSAEDLTRATLLCRSQITDIMNFLHEYVPGYENCWLMETASLLGVRETRHFEGEESLGSEDIVNAKYHDNWIVKRAYFNFDVHNLTGASLDKTGVQKEFKQDKPYTVPFGCILPKNVDGLLLSGRNISGSHLAHANYRAMPIAMAIGEAAGVVAALCCRYGLKSCRDVDIKEVQSIVGK